MNKYAFELVERKQPFYKPIYAPSPVELETLKTYIEIHLKTWFIRPFKSSANILIFFNKKLDSSLYLYVNYQDFNNLKIKN